jgi:4-hydroxy-tetrahydrodipicolinate synthase
MAGGDGVLCGLTNVAPEIFMELYRAYEGKNFETVVAKQRQINELMRIYNVSNPFIAAIKVAVMLTGRKMIPMVKAPAAILDEQGMNKVKNILVKANVL